MGFMDRFRGKFGKNRGNQGSQGQVPVMAKPGKARMGGFLGKLMGGKGMFGAGGGMGRFMKGQGQMPPGAGPQAGGMQKLGMFQPGVQGGNQGFTPGNFQGRLRQMMQRRRRPMGGGPGRPGGPPTSGGSY